MRGGRPAEVREWCEWHLICTAMVHQACMTMRMQRNSCQNASCIAWREDIVVSQDYGVAAMVLGKGAYAIHQSGKWYTNENIDQMLMERHLNKKARRGSHKNHIKGPRKRTEEDDVRFAQSFEKMIQTIMQIR